MDEHECLAERFEANRPHLRAVAYRMLGSLSEADDAVQESWLRLSRSGTSGVENLGGWLTTVVARVCLDMLRSRKSRHEESLEARIPDPIASRESGTDPEHEALLADSVDLPCSWSSKHWLPPSGSRSCCTTSSPCLLKRSLRSSNAPRRRHGSSPAAPAGECMGRGGEMGWARGWERPRVPTPISLGSEKSSMPSLLPRGGDFDALLAVLDPDVVLRSDRAALPSGPSREIRGAAAVARRAMVGGARAAQPALVNGAVGVVVAPRGRLLMVLVFTISHGKIVEIDAVADPERLRQLDLAVLND